MKTKGCFFGGGSEWTGVGNATQKEEGEEGREIAP